MKFCVLVICRRACTESRINTIDTTGEANTTGPVVYLLKLLVRQAGFVCLNKIVQTRNWVVPHELGRDEVPVLPHHNGCHPSIDCDFIGRKDFGSICAVHPSLYYYQEGNE